MAYETSDPLLNSGEGAQEAGVSKPCFWKAVADGRLPAPYYPAPRAPRWRLSELRAALEATRALPAHQKLARAASRRQRSQVA